MSPVTSMVRAVGIGGGPLGGEVVDAPVDRYLVCNVASIDGSLHPEPEIHVSYQYRLLHLRFGGWIYHVLAPDTMTKTQEVTVEAVRALLRLDAATRREVACFNLSCELTRTDRVVEF